MALWAIALFSPVDTLAVELLSLHMAQHLMIAELGAPLILVGLRAPVIYFFLPKPAMVWLAHRRTLRRVMRKLTTPARRHRHLRVVLYGWHFAPAFEAALHNPFVHALQHESFFVIAILVWIPALEPTRRRLRGELWKAGPHHGRAAGRACSSARRSSSCARRPTTGTSAARPSTGSARSRTSGSRARS